MAYQSTRLRREFEINELVTVHYFEYPLNFAFHGESHDFWEFLYVDRGGIRVTAGDQELMLSAGQAIFHEPWEFHAFRSVGKRPPNLVVVSFCCDSPFLDFFRQAAFTLSEEERELISKLLAAAVQCFATPLNARPWKKWSLIPTRRRAVRIRFSSILSCSFSPYTAAAPRHGKLSARCALWTAGRMNVRPENLPMRLSPIFSCILRRRSPCANLLGLLHLTFPA